MRWSNFGVYDVIISLWNSRRIRVLENILIIIFVNSQLLVIFGFCLPGSELYVVSHYQNPSVRSSGLPQARLSEAEWNSYNYQEPQGMCFFNKYSGLMKNLCNRGVLFDQLCVIAVLGINIVLEFRYLPYVLTVAIFISFDELNWTKTYFSIIKIADSVIWKLLYIRQWRDFQ